MAEFAAKYPGVCAAGDDIKVGEELTYLDDDLMHTDCARNVAREERNAERFTGTTDEEMGF